MAKMTADEAKTEYRAVTRFLIVSPIKLRPVADLVRRKTYPEAVSILENMPHKGAKLIRKTVISAASNALNQDKQLVEDMLFIKSIFIDEGPRMKRIWYRGRGRADMLKKKMSHITVVVDQIANAAAPSKSSGTASRKKSPSKRAGK